MKLLRSKANYKFSFKALNNSAKHNFDALFFEK